MPHQPAGASTPPAPTRADLTLTPQHSMERPSNLRPPTAPTRSAGSRGASVPAKPRRGRRSRGSAAAATSGGENGGTSQCAGSGASRAAASSRRPGRVVPFGDRSVPAQGPACRREPPAPLRSENPTLAAEAGRDPAGNCGTAGRLANYSSREAARRRAASAQARVRRAWRRQQF